MKIAKKTIWLKIKYEWSLDDALCLYFKTCKNFALKRFLFQIYLLIKYIKIKEPEVKALSNQFYQLKHKKNLLIIIYFLSIIFIPFPSNTCLENLCIWKSNRNTFDFIHFFFDNAIDNFICKWLMYLKFIKIDSQIRWHRIKG